MHIQNIFSVQTYFFQKQSNTIILNGAISRGNNGGPTFIYDKSVKLIIPFIMMRKYASEKLLYSRPSFGILLRINSDYAATKLTISIHGTGMAVHSPTHLSKILSHQPLSAYMIHI